MTLSSKTIAKLTAICLAAGMGLSAATPALAEGYNVGETARTFNFAHWDRLNIRAWPASHSQKVAHIRHGKTVFVERCIVKSGTDWCKIRRGYKRGWVNGSFLIRDGQSFGDIHHIAWGWH
jgi:uncharacterized protein YraI